MTTPVASEVDPRSEETLQTQAVPHWLQIVDSWRRGQVDTATRTHAEASSGPEPVRPG